MSLNHKSQLNNLEDRCLKESACYPWGKHFGGGGDLIHWENIMVSASFFSTRLVPFVRANKHFV